MSTESISDRREHIRSISVTALSALLGVGAALGSAALTGDLAPAEAATDTRALMLVVGAILVQFVLFDFTSIYGDDEFGIKHYLFITFMTFSFWFVGGDLTHRGGRRLTMADDSIAVVDLDRCQPDRCSYECKNYCPPNRTGKECITLRARTPTRVNPNRSTSPKRSVSAKPVGSASRSALRRHRDHQPAQGTPGRPSPPLRRERILAVRPARPTGRTGDGYPRTERHRENDRRPHPRRRTRAKPRPPRRGRRLGRRTRGLPRHGTPGLHRGRSRRRGDRRPQAQYVDQIPNSFDGNTRELLEKTDERDALDHLVERLSIGPVMEQSIDDLSGGELQRVAIAATLARDTDFYFLDEVTPYLDIGQRVTAARLIRELAEETDRCSSSNTTSRSWTCSPIPFTSPTVNRAPTVSSRRRSPYATGSTSIWQATSTTRTCGSAPINRVRRTRPRSSVRGDTLVEYPDLERATATASSVSTSRAARSVRTKCWGSSAPTGSGSRRSRNC